MGNGKRRMIGPSFVGCLAVLGLLMFAPGAAWSDEAEHGEHREDARHEGDAHGEHADDDGHVSEAYGLRALHPWTRATSDPTAFVFVELENTGGEEITLLGAEADVAESTDIVGMRLADGDRMYEKIARMPIAAGTEMHLEPDGLAIRLNGLQRALRKDDTVEVELKTSAGAIDLHVLVEDATARQHRHAGHQH